MRCNWTQEHHENKDLYLTATSLAETEYQVTSESYSISNSIHDVKVYPKTKYVYAVADLQLTIKKIVVDYYS